MREPYLVITLNHIRMSDQFISSQLTVTNTASYAAVATLILYSAYKLGTWAGEFCANLSIEV